MRRAHTFAGHKVLVAGASGFLGTHLVRRLISDGATVVAVSRTRGTAVDPRIDLRSLDLTNRQSVTSLIDEIQPDIVYQLCSHPDGRRNLSLVLPTFESDVLTTINLLVAATKRPVARFIISTSLECPAVGEVPTSPYAAAKLASTAYAQMFQLLYGVPVVALRPFMTYGPGQSHTKIVPHIIRSLIAGKKPDIHSGERLVDWIYVDDVIEGFLAAAQTTGVEGGVFDLGSGSMISVRDIATRIATLMHSEVALTFRRKPCRPFEVVRHADFAHAKAILGWQSRIALDDGLERTIKWWRGNPAGEDSPAFLPNYNTTKPSRQVSSSRL